MKTRADLKRELDSKIPPGEEQSHLTTTLQTLTAHRLTLQTLRDERATLMREISIRERKLQDWKGKIPRPPHPPTLQEALSEVQRAGPTPCHNIGTLTTPHNLTIHKPFRPALQGLQGFDRLWLIALAPPNDTLTHGKCASSAHNSRSLYLWLVSLISVNPQTGIIQIADLTLPPSYPISDIIILDIKPYLPYCDSLTATQT